MYNILLIDDEPGIVEGLRRQLGKEDWDLQVYATSTVREGVSIAQKVKIDILCSDIQMPVMNGFQFAKKVLEYWGDCKVIFLTGYNEFDYVYKTIHEFGGKYVLKSDEERLNEAIKQYLSVIEKEEQNKLLSEKLRDLIKKYHDTRKQHCWEEYLKNEFAQEIFDELKSFVNEENVQDQKPIYCAIGCLLSDGKNLEIEKKIPLCLFKVREEYQYFYEIYSVFLKHENTYLILVQQKQEECPDFQSLLESIQNKVLDLGNQKISFFYSENPIMLNEVKRQVELFFALAKINWAENNPVLVKLEEVMKKENNGNDYEEKQEIQLERWLMEQKFGILKETFQELYVNIKNSKVHNLSDVQEYYKGVGIITSYIQCYMKYSDIPEDLQKNYFHLKYMTSEQEIHRFIMEFLEYMEKNSNNEITEEQLIIQKIENYIVNHISEDISLDNLAELTYFNPSYLSRFYKSNTGKNISSFIAETKIMKAKELLKSSNEKIEDISEMLGFKSSGYFTVFLKKHIGMTPTEYRNNSFSKK